MPSKPIYSVTNTLQLIWGSRFLLTYIFLNTLFCILHFGSFLSITLLVFEILLNIVFLHTDKQCQSNSKLTITCCWSTVLHSRLLSKAWAWVLSFLLLVTISFLENDLCLIFVFPIAVAAAAAFLILSFLLYCWLKPGFVTRMTKYHFAPVCYK